MTKKFMMILSLLTAISSFADSRIERINNDPVRQSIVQAIEKKYNVYCQDIDESKIQWRCFNGPECAYTAPVRCHLRDTDSVGGLDLFFDGYDNSQTHDLMSFRLRHLK